VTAWQKRYVEVMDDLYEAYTDAANPKITPDVVAAVTSLAEEIREGLDAGLLDADATRAQVMDPMRGECRIEGCDHTTAMLIHRQAQQV
jgi:hypothetical protein